MTLYAEAEGMRLYLGDARTVLAGLPEQSVHCVVTSPPYWGLRSYKGAPVDWEDGWHGSLGLEPTPQLYVAHLVEVFRAVRRVLRDDGTLWLNLGDSAAGSGGAHKAEHANPGLSKSASRDGIADRPFTQDPDAGAWEEAGLRGHWKRNGTVHYGQIDPSRYLPPVGTKERDMVGIPWMTAFALRADGWYLRRDVVWEKVNPMPESVDGWRWERHRVKVNRDTWLDCPGCPTCDPNDGLVLRKGSWRPTASHEYIFMLAKSPGYYADREAVREPMRASSIKRLSQPTLFDQEGGGRNLRDVWTFATKPYRGGHYAVFPDTLPTIAIKAATPEGGVCGACGTPWARVIGGRVAVGTAEGGRTSGNPARKLDTAGAEARTGTHLGYAIPWETSRTVTAGWRPVCGCGVAAVPATVLDPFGGTATTVLAARALGRAGVAIDLSEDYMMQALIRLLGTEVKKGKGAKG